MATISDKRLQHSTDGTAIDYFDADVQTAQEYYAFGSIVPGRTYSAGKGYRYGFNGKENDNEVKKDLDGNPNIGTQQDYGMRIYDGRLGRFLSVDPLSPQYPYYTPYQFAGNKPTRFIDMDGLEEADPMQNLSMESAKVGIAIGDFFVSAVHSVRNLIAATPFAQQPAQGMKWESIQVWSKDANRYVFEMKQVPMQGLVKDVMGHSLDGLNVAGTIGLLNFPKGTAGGKGSLLKVNTTVKEEVSAASRYPGVAADYSSRTIGQLQKTIRSTSRTIAEHEEFIKNPLSKPGMTQEKWTEMSEQARNGLLNKWANDIERNKAYVDIAKDALRSKQP